MPDHAIRTVDGEVTHIFGHRFVVQTSKGAVLADLTPHGAERITLTAGDHVTLVGEMKPTELKVSQFTRGGETTEIVHEKKHKHDDTDPGIATKAAKQAGFETVGQPRRKPKHFVVLGRRNDALTELHIELDGHIRKQKPADRNDPKWKEALQSM